MAPVGSDGHCLNKGGIVVEGPTHTVLDSQGRMFLNLLRGLLSTSLPMLLLRSTSPVGIAWGREVGSLQEMCSMLYSAAVVC